MKNYVQPGKTITLTAPYAVASGDGLLVGSIVGLASGNAANGESVETALVGIFNLKKIASQAWSAGDKALLGQHQQGGDEDRHRQYAHRRGDRGGGWRRCSRGSRRGSIREWWRTCRSRRGGSSTTRSGLERRSSRWPRSAWRAASRWGRGRGPATWR
jgi:predicted RecA/RadA family phage recombinase